MESKAEAYQLAAEVELLYTSYCEVLDDAEIEHWPDFFAHESLYRITTRENLECGMPLSLVFCDGLGMLRDRALALQKIVMYRRRFQRRLMSGVRLVTSETVDVSCIKTRASFFVYESVGDEPTQVLVSGRSEDVIVREGRTLKFKQRLCVIDSLVIPDSLVFPI